MTYTRRSLLKLLGATLSLAGLEGCRRPEELIVPHVIPPEERLPGVPEHYATTMPFGMNAYGLVVESHDGRPTKIEGNALHPASAGATNAFAQAEIYGLYDPDRAPWISAGGVRKSRDELVAQLVTLREAHLPSGGKGLAVLSEPFCSPTTFKAAQRFRERFPSVEWATYEPCSRETIDRGIEMATGLPLRELLHPARAEILLSLDADFLVTDPEATRHAREFADGRRLANSRQGMNRLYVVESQYTGTGALADHRLRLRAGDVPGFVNVLAVKLGIPGAQSGGLEIDARWMDRLVKDLLAARGRSLLVAGPHLSSEVHATVLVINAFLGNIDNAVTLIQPVDSYRSSLEDLQTLTSHLQAGDIDTLLILGGNPVYTAPVELGLADAIGRAGTVLRLGPYVDESAKLASWHIPQPHFLESWGDARAADGSLSVIQPLIRPLFGGYTLAELLATLDTGEPVDPHVQVRETWQRYLDAGNFEKEWRVTLHDGVLPESSLPEILPDIEIKLPGNLLTDAEDDGDFELVFRPGSSTHDGRYANNAWLQELPDPVTKLTWDNAAQISPASARILGVTNGERMRISCDDRQLELPVLIVPGQADRSIGLSLGYGRTAAGRIGNGVGFDTYALRPATAGALATGAAVVKSDGSYSLATTQDHWAIDDVGRDGRDARLPSLLRRGTLAQYRTRPTFARDDHQHRALESLHADHDYTEGNQWGMTIDLNACTGCNACVIACQCENNIPVVGKREVELGREMHWIRIDRYYSGDPDDPEALYFQPVTCQHCENAPCEEVCPVAATVHDAEGLNTMVYNRCIGTRYCSNNCPYKVRRFNYFNLTKDLPELLELSQNPNVTVRSRGVMEKCSFCVQRIAAGRLQARVEGADFTGADVVTACQQACPTRAISFGNLLDPQSDVAVKRTADRSYELLAELNNRPRISYLARIHNPAESDGES
jgi:Fe-S-cluster-containing dehydrogenase component